MLAKSKVAFCVFNKIFSLKSSIFYIIYIIKFLTCYEIDTLCVCPAKVKCLMFCAKMETVPAWETMICNPATRVRMNCKKCMKMWYETFIFYLKHYIFECTVKPLYSEQSRDPKKCSLYGGVHPRGVRYVVTQICPCTHVCV